MRLRPYLSGSEAPRPFSDVLADRGTTDPSQRVLEEIHQLEREAQACDDLVERNRLQCQAEDLRCALDENSRRSP